MKHYKSTETQGSFLCCYCTKTMKYDGSNSTGIERHLKNFHRKEYSAFQEEKKEQKAKVLDNNNSKGKKRNQETKPKDGNPKLKQAKFAWTIEDKELQKRWDKCHC